MTVYVVTTGEYSDYRIYGIYTTRRLAEKAIAVGMIFTTYSSEFNDIEEMETDQKADIPVAYAVFKRGKEDGFREERDESPCLAPGVFGDIEYEYYLVRVTWSPDKNVMIKAARDRFAMFQAMRQGI